VEPPGPGEIEAFLHYGFVPRVPDDLGARAWARTNPARLPEDEAHCVALGVAALRAAFEPVPPGPQVVPLSGGLDSRVILGMLAAAGAAERCVAVTFGTPGTLDFELGRAVARHAGVRHETIDLTREPLDEERLCAVLARAPAWTHVFEAFFNALVPARFGAGAVVWSGIMANVVNGSRLGAGTEDWGSARRRFARENRYARSTDLDRPGSDPLQSLPGAPLPVAAPLSFHEQLHMALVYPCRFEPCLLAPGFDYRTPFRQPPWLEFAFALPPALRRGQRGFRRVAARALPELLSLPTKSRHGVPLGAPAWRAGLARQRLRAGRFARRLLPGLPWRPRPETNYLDVDHALRRPSALREVVRACLARLARRDVVPWIDVEGLWRRHQRGWRNHGDALELLALLELNLAAREERPFSPRA
jgi:hypothetical protein